MHWPTHVNVLPILTYPLCRIGFGFHYDGITVKGFCFGFDLTDLFDLQLYSIIGLGFLSFGLIPISGLRFSLGFFNFNILGIIVLF